jgi:nitroreductase
MDLWQAVEERCSIRKFTPDPIPDEHIRRMIDCARLAPSASNSQPWRFVVVRNKEVMQKMSAAISAKVQHMLQWPAAHGHESQVRAIEGYSTFFTRAPITIAVLTKPYGSASDELLQRAGLSFEERYRLRPAPGIQSVGAAIEHLLLAAWELGYGTCWMTGPMVAAPELEKVLGIEEPWHMAALIPVGVPAEKVKPKNREPLENVMTIID